MMRVGSNFPQIVFSQEKTEGVIAIPCESLPPCSRYLVTLEKAEGQPVIRGDLSPVILSLGRWISSLSSVGEGQQVAIGGGSSVEASDFYCGKVVMCLCVCGVCLEQLISPAPQLDLEDDASEPDG